MDMTACAFTGHRPHKLPWGYDETDRRCIATKDALAGQISALASIGVTDFYSGMADGTDIWASLAVLDLRANNSAVKLHCVMPYPGQEKRWPSASQERYWAILDRADDVKTLSKMYYDGCLLARNRYLVDAAGYLLAVYCGATHSGTASTINYARMRGRRIIIIDPIERVIHHAIKPRV